MHVWGATLPYDCYGADDGGCISTTHDHYPMVGDECSRSDCRAPFAAGELVYAVYELRAVFGPPPARPNARARWREQWVCWRHVRGEPERT